MAGNKSNTMENPTTYVRATRQPICEEVNGERTVIEAGRIGLVEEERVEPLGALVERSDKKAFAAQQAAGEKKPGKPAG